MRIGLAIGILAVATGAAAASEPWVKPMAGCVRAGVLISDDGYPIRVRDRLDRPELDLGRFEGRHIVFSHGYLLPGDVYVRQSRARVTGPCGPR